VLAARVKTALDGIDFPKDVLSNLHALLPVSQPIHEKITLSHFVDAKYGILALVSPG